MAQLGIGVMIGMLFGDGSTTKALQSAAGKTIAALELGSDDALHFTFDDGATLRIADEGQSCCERRYMRTDDDLQGFIGAKFTGAQLKEAPNVDDGDDYGEHEIQFLEIQTNRGVFTMASHNEHNGYYGGFHICATGTQA